MRAKVLKEFPGCTDGNPVTRMIKEGETIEGDLAKVAVDEGWAEAINHEAADDERNASPFENMNVAQLKAFAVEKSIDLGAATKRADIIAILEAKATGADA